MNALACRWFGVLVLSASAAGGGSAPAAEDQSRDFLLRETAGFRRFGYPVHARLPAVASGRNFRLERGGKAVPAQFRVVKNSAGQDESVALDFAASPGPLEAEKYTVRWGDGVEPGPEPKSGMSVERIENHLVVSHGPSLRYQLPSRGACLIDSVRNVRQEFLKDNAPGLYLQGPAGKLAEEAATTVRHEITRSGPLAVGVRVERVEGLSAPTPLRSTVDLTFPSSKSWVEAVWTVDDPEARVGDLVVALNTLMTGQPVLVDFGAANTVYSSLRGGDQWMILRAGEAPGVFPLATAWEIVKQDKPTSLLSFARSLPASPGKAEGWAHVMDSNRCVAVAVDRFGTAQRDSIRIDGEGRVVLSREFGKDAGKPAGGPKSLRFWFHFVPTPVQVGAVTSPQAMQSPLRVQWAGDSAR